MDFISKIVKDLINEHYMYISMCESNITGLETHISIIKAKTKELQAHSEIAHIYFQQQLQEREKLFNSASAVLNKAIELGDVEFAQIATKSIQIVHSKSPFSF